MIRTTVPHAAFRIAGLAGALLAPLTLVACGGSSSDDDPLAPDATATTPAGGTAASSWRLDGRFDYVGDPAAAASTTGDIGADAGEFGVIVISTSGFDRTNGDWSGSSLSLSHSLDGAGAYTVVDTAGLVRTVSESPGSPVVTLSAQAGVIEDGSTRWQAVGGTLEAIVDDGGNYRFSTLEPVPATVEIELGAGIPDRPETITIEIENVFGRPSPASP